MRNYYKQRFILAMAVLGLCGLSRAEVQADDFRPFNGFFADLFGDDSQQQQQQKPVRSQQSQTQRQQPTPALQPTPASQATPSDAPDQSYGQPRVRHTMPHAAADALMPSPPATSSNGAPAPSASPTMTTSKNLAFHFDDGVTADPTSPAPTAALTNSPEAVPIAGGAPSLHDTLQGSQQSPFGSATTSTPDSGSPATVPSTVSSGSPTPGSPAAELTNSAGKDQGGAPATLAAPPATDASANSAPANSSQVSPATSSSAPKSEHAAPTVPAEEPHRVAKGDAGPQVLSAHKSPILTTETVGPQRISVGKEAAYEVILQNSGEAAAEEVSVSVLLPEWADIANVTPSSGSIRANTSGKHEPCQWIVGRVEAKSSERLSLKIIPRASKPFELAVRFDFKAAPTQAMIEVQEPHLALKLDGPREVLFGKHEVYKLKLSNQGTGAAENVVLRLMPLAGGDPQPVSHKLGTLAAGDERSIEIELTARQAGNLLIHVDAMADANARAELSEKVVVRRAELKIETDGPVVQYVGTPAIYKIHVRNPGDAQANKVKLAVKLPPGVRFLAGTDGATVTNAEDGTRVQWMLDHVAAGSSKDLSIKCTLALSGANRIEIAAIGEDEVAATSETTTRAEALADLRLDVKDPEGPVPVGQEATYELRIRNRGTKAAEGVEVFAFFSSGVEPIGGEGHPHRVSPGQVVFAPLPVLPPATEVILRVKAKATLSGNHVFRAEIHCRTSGTRLVREETTHFYQEGIADTQPDSAPQMSAQNQPVQTPGTEPAPIASSQNASSRTDRPAMLPTQQPASPLPGANSASRSPNGNRF